MNGLNVLLRGVKQGWAKSVARLTVDIEWNYENYYLFIRLCDAWNVVGSLVCKFGTLRP